eukprot:CAMPEP_0197920650 /NCGR_PEP_ID=MMETSP1439-20131203/89353_1 /TAXON_ID=66791 /ORGANISM="Gonyaulax spinifera, Strain CCMP409" /LENGTH=51 /DNA_ID=CAMNT_0043542859 /DNA_START=136 /DNA_END=287 /DNA_ORIENTATION=-
MPPMVMSESFRYSTAEPSRWGFPAAICSKRAQSTYVTDVMMAIQPVYLNPG